MLHLNSTKRLSIDIDIVMHEPIKLQALFDQISGDKEFIRAEEQERHVNYNIEKAHYKFYYTPVYKTAQDEEYILLDILFEQPKYIQLVPLRVCKFHIWLYI